MEPLALIQPALTSRPPGKGCFGTYPVLPLRKQLQVKLQCISDSKRQLLLQSFEFETHSSTGWELPKCQATICSGCSQQVFSWGTSKNKLQTNPPFESVRVLKGNPQTDLAQSRPWATKAPPGKTLANKSFGCHSYNATRIVSHTASYHNHKSGLCDQEGTPD